MRHRLLLLVLATTSAVVLAFLIPLTLLLRTLAEDRAVAAATQEANSVAAAVTTWSSTDRARLRQLVAYTSEDSIGVITVFLPDGTVLGQPVDDDTAVRRAAGGEAFTRRGHEGADVYVPAVSNKGITVVRVAVPESALRQGVARATAILAGLGLGLLVAAVLVADQVARRVSAPILTVAATARQLREGTLSARAAEAGPPEVATLARALNQLAERVVELLAAERDAVADLSHRLRTPLTALRLDADGVADPEARERLRDHVAVLERSVDAIVHDARRQVRTEHAATCEVGRVVGERVAFWSALADDQGRQLRLYPIGDPVRVRIHEADLADVVDVLIDNVFAHTGEGVPLHVRLARTPEGGATLTVEDGGPGLPNGDVVSRGASTAGSSGLGLDIARRAALASGGRLEVGRSALGGALVRVVLGPARG